MDVDGECHCGEIAFSAQVEPTQMTICHCTDCQAMSGSAFRANISCSADNFRLLRGEPSLYVKTAESGARREMGFCPRCGSQVFARAVDGLGPYSLRTGTLRQRASFRPARQIWLRSALPWAKDLFQIPAFASEASPDD